MRARQLVWMRRISQSVFLLFFLFLLLESRLPRDVFLDYSVVFSAEPDLTINYPIGFFFQLDPLAWFSSLISGHQLIKGFWWALGLLVVTVFMGRVFCGFVCPLGTLHHAASWFRPSLKGNAMTRANEKASSQKIKYFLLVTVLVGAVFGLNMAGLLDPLSLLFRSLALAVLPGAATGLREFSEVIANSDVTAFHLLSYAGEAIAQFLSGFGYQAYKTAWFIGIVFLVILFLNRIRPRFWCRVMCPLGALLGICSRFSMLRLEKDKEKCTDCELCVKSCQGAASPKPGHDWENAECLMCFNCFDSCPTGALSFRFRWASPRLKRGPDMGRRALLAGLVGGISLPLFGRLDGHIHKVADPRLIRPPGALSEKEFLTFCQRCGLCMKACPTNVINPTLTEAGFAGFWTPHLIMTQGYCEYTCTLCGDVCPTGAIRKFSVKEKIETPIVIGSAFIDRGRCLPWSGNGP